MDLAELENIPSRIAALEERLSILATRVESGDWAAREAVEEARAAVEEAKAAADRATESELVALTASADAALITSEPASETPDAETVAEIVEDAAEEAAEEATEQLSEEIADAVAEEAPPDMAQEIADAVEDDSPVNIEADEPPRSTHWLTKSWGKR